MKTTPTIREHLQKVLSVPDSDFIESPNSDLLVNVTPITAAFISSHYIWTQNKYTVFTDQITGKKVYDIAFWKDEPLDLYQSKTI